MKNHEITKHHYDSHSLYYEKWQGSLQGGYHFGFPKKFLDVLSNTRMIQNLTDLVIDTLAITRSQKILDAGCGKGQMMVQMLKKRPDQDIEVNGVTLSPVQFSLGKTFLEKQHSKAKIFLEDFEKTHFPDTYFDAIVFTDSLCHGEGNGKEKALLEMSRILKSEGKIVICDVFLRKTEESSSQYFQKISNKTRRAWAVDSWIVEPEFLDVAKRLGFKKTHEEPINAKIAPSVLQLPLRLLPTALIVSLFKKTYAQARKTLSVLAFTAPLLGIHPNFQYKLVVLERTRKEA